MFIDRVDISVKAGDGGDGANSFSKIKCQKKRPDGGEGGRGGNVILIADKNVQTLIDFYYRRHFRAEPGKRGGGNHRKGHHGGDLVIKVPPGTLIKDKYEDITYCDLTEDGFPVIFLKGGAGGKGNSRFREATLGEPGEEKEIILELKLIADVGIIGYPNAGKSSLITRISNARSKIASFPFTTKTPVLGVVKVDENRSFVVCDIPGLIEGAHSGKGLGDAFLRHIERTKILIHVIDMAAIDGRNPADDYKSINDELRQYNIGLLNKAQILTANKMDMEIAKENLKNFKKSIKKKIYPISCITGEGIKKLLEAVYDQLTENR